jgi:hypothetical protein
MVITTFSPMTSCSEILRVKTNIIAASWLQMNDVARDSQSFGIVKKRWCFKQMKKLNSGRGNLRHQNDGANNFFNDLEKTNP